jgi:uncharacterized caspase-like protein
MEASMLKHFAVCLLGLAALLAALTPAAAEKRVALVIGNAAYQNAPPLRNPSNDATDIAAKLRELGFDVVEGIDLKKRDMEKRIRAFAEQLNGADVGLFYYAGHGLQVNQKNYLAPIDAELKSETDLDFEAVELDLVLKQMLRSAGTSLVFLDACRDNPLVQKLAQSGRSLNIGRGLARVEPVSSMMIVYSAEFGKVALDGTGRNSPFTEALLRHIGEEGESISDMMIEVRNDVRKETGNQQQPIESTQLTGQFFFKPAPQQAAAKSSSTDAEIAALRQEIARLQADQGALLKSQQEQLALLQKKLAEETKPSEVASPPPNVPTSDNASRVIAVEPAASSANSTPATTSAPSPSQPANSASPEAATKLAATEGTGPEETPEASKATEAPAPLPQGASRQELAQDMLAELKRIGCYFGRLDGNWSGRSQLALERFNRLASLELPLDEPQQASLDALKGWKGPHCPIEKAVPPRFKQRPVVAPKKEAPPRKAVRASPPKPPRVQAFEPRPQPRPQEHGSDEVRELQRAFPSSAWPGQ